MNRSWRDHEQFIFEYVKFELFIKHPGRNAALAIAYFSLEITVVVQGKHVNLGIIS